MDSKQNCRWFFGTAPSQEHLPLPRVVAIDKPSQNRKGRCHLTVRTTTLLLDRKALASNRRKNPARLSGRPGLSLKDSPFNEKVRTKVFPYIRPGFSMDEEPRAKLSRGASENGFATNRHVFSQPEGQLGPEKNASRHRPKNKSCFFNELREPSKAGASHVRSSPRGS